MQRRSQSSSHFIITNFSKVLYDDNIAEAMSRARDESREKHAVVELRGGNQKNGTECDKKV